MAAVRPHRTTPSYAVNSVDNALRLLQTLRDVGEVRVKEAAQDLGVSPSTVHRLMSMLVFRGFAQQDDTRSYLPGPSMGVPVVRLPGTRELLAVAKPHLTRLRDATGETAYCWILTGRLVRCILTVSASSVSAIGDRRSAWLHDPGRGVRGWPCDPRRAARSADHGVVWTGGPGFGARSGHFASASRPPRADPRTRIFAARGRVRGRERCGSVASERHAPARCGVDLCAVRPGRTSTLPRDA